MLLVALLTLVYSFFGPPILVALHQLTNRTKLWLAGGIVAVLMFGAGVFWATCAVR
jgi:hypothetical protein